MARRLALWGLAGVTAGLLVMPAQSASAVAPFSPIADSYTDSSTPTTNFGSKTYVKADGSPQLRSYLKFDVQGRGSETTAALRFQVLSNHNLGLEIRSVSDTGWDERAINHNNAPAVGSVLRTTGAVTAGEWVTVDVSSAVTGDGLVSLALTTPSGTSVKVASRESSSPPQLLVPAPGSESPWVVTREGDNYRATSEVTGRSYAGSLKAVVENAVGDLQSTGGGTVRFTAGTFDFGTDHFEFYDVFDVVFEGAGMGQTILKNNTSESDDTEPFDFSGVERVTIRDMTVSAGGPFRSTSDALDFDNGTDIVVERVEVTASRGRGIVFDGKNDNWDALRNTVRDCVIDGVPSDGIELLASSNNLVEGCTITNVGGHGIQLAKASTSADQPNKKSNDNVIRNNVVDESALDGFNLNGGDRNQIVFNSFTNNSDNSSGRDGIRLGTGDSVSCNDNVVANNVSTDNQATKTQRYGLNISSSLCNRTVVGPSNDFSGNRVRAINDVGTGTVFL
jgi:parallel beta-helix repeat protein